MQKLKEKEKAPGTYPISVRRGDTTSNAMPFLVDTLSERLDREPNNSARNAQRVKTPIIIDGRIDQAGDWDVFRLEGRAGEKIVAEVYARRMDSPLDSVLRMTDASRRQLAFNDDHEDKGSGLDTHHADSMIMASLPAKGSYFLFIGDAQQKGGQEYSCRLRISAPRPDYDLRVVPATINAIGGTAIPLTVYALRKDGFSGDIAINLKNAPKGFVLDGAVVPSGQDKIRLTLTVPQQVLSEAICEPSAPRNRT